ncbi:sensor histidine kinase [Allofournierella massiliensis]|uniref:histidine kinase n=1 Tax=Allofournierella massiliensis TaxID=1650663 RepID=A0A4R1R5K3_9FIRM|nr:HAMP domain-containing sensor histidine kinase [Fournierella massiliensis]TCL60804.1 signal transduction histidine kinase [Fournierella massiliensis]
MAKTKPHFFSLRYRLMMFLCLASAFVLILVWVFVTHFMQPLYNHYIYKHLLNQVNTVVSIIESSTEPISTRSLPILDAQVSSSFEASLLSAIQSRKLDASNTCFDLADSTLQHVTGFENLYPCLLHEASFTTSINGKTSVWNGSVVESLRATVLSQGFVKKELVVDKNASTRQMAVGRVAKNGDETYSVIFCTSLARIDEAGVVLGQLMPWIFLCLMAFSIVASWLFSRWFTKPLTKLSHATRQLAEGDYSVRVNVPETDEIGLLAADFNHMAGEVSRAAQLQRDLLANVSHDLRTPLTLIKGYAETVRDLTGDNPEKRTAQLDVIVDETDRLSGLVNSVMELSKMSSGTDKPEKVRFDLSQLCEEVAQRYEAVCAQNGYTLKLELPDPETDCTISAGPAMMERVLHNLLGNAMHHIGPDNIFILRVNAPEKGTVRVEVADHGAGIAKEDLPYIFDRYYRSRSDAGKVGTGLGLSITKAILQSHGFRFGVNSTLGEGSCFWFEAKDQG